MLQSIWMDRLTNQTGIMFSLKQVNSMKQSSLHFISDLKIHRPNYASFHCLISLLANIREDK